MADRLLPTIEVRIPVRGGRLLGDLAIPNDPIGVVVFAHGSGSSRFSPRNRAVARRLQSHGLATLLVDLLTPIEEAQDRRTAHLRFDIELLVRRVEATLDWSLSDSRLRGLPIGLYGSSTGAAAALAAAAHEPDVVAAIVARSGRPDLVEPLLPQVMAPTLFVVGSHDSDLLDRNQYAATRLHCTHRTSIVSGASQLFAEPGALDRAANLASAWFVRHLAESRSNDADEDTQAASTILTRYADRAAAGAALAQLVGRDAPGLVEPIVVALPHGGVEVAAPVAAALDAPLEAAVARAICAPSQPELVIGSVDEEGATTFTDSLLHALRLSPRETRDLSMRATATARREAHALRDGRPLPAVAGHDVLLVDDGYVDGMLAASVARMLHRHGARRVILAVPIAPRSLLHEPPTEFDGVVCPYAPDPLDSIGSHYARFDHVPDSRAHELLHAARDAEQPLTRP